MRNRIKGPSIRKIENPGHRSSLCRAVYSAVSSGVEGFSEY